MSNVNSESVNTNYFERGHDNFEMGEKVKTPTKEKNGTDISEVTMDMK